VKAELRREDQALDAAGREREALEWNLRLLGGTGHGRGLLLTVNDVRVRTSPHLQVRRLAASEEFRAGLEGNFHAGGRMEFTVPVTRGCAIVRFNEESAGRLALRSDGDRLGGLREPQSKEEETK
jgi:hypothetical protein